MWIKLLWEYEFESCLVVYIIWFLNFEYVRKLLYGEFVFSFVKVVVFFVFSEILEELIYFYLLIVDVFLGYNFNCDMMKFEIVNILIKFLFF